MPLFGAAKAPPNKGTTIFFLVSFLVLRTLDSLYEELPIEMAGKRKVSKNFFSMERIVVSTIESQLSAKMFFSLDKHQFRNMC